MVPIMPPPNQTQRVGGVMHTGEDRHSQTNEVKNEWDGSEISHHCGRPVSFS